MSSSASSYYTGIAVEKKKEKCKKSPTGNHVWIPKGAWPSKAETCKYCDTTVYHK